MSRRKNELNLREIRIMETKVKTYVESFAAALDLFLKDCEVRNLRPHTIRYYQNEIHACLNQLREQGINVETLSPVLVTQEHIKENVIAYMRHQKGLRIVTNWWQNDRFCHQVATIIPPGVSALHMTGLLIVVDDFIYGCSFLLMINN